MSVSLALSLSAIYLVDDAVLMHVFKALEYLEHDGGERPGLGAFGRVQLAEVILHEVAVALLRATVHRLLEVAAVN